MGVESECNHVVRHSLNVNAAQGGLEWRTNPRAKGLRRVRTEYIAHQRVHGVSGLEKADVSCETRLISMDMTLANLTKSSNVKMVGGN